MIFISNSYNFHQTIKEAHDVDTTESYRKTWLNRAVTLFQACQSDFASLNEILPDWWKRHLFLSFHKVCLITPKGTCESQGANYS